MSWIDTLNRDSISREDAGRLLDLVKLTRNMRSLQRAYYRNKGDRQALTAAIQAETEMDRMLETPTHRR